MSKKVSQQRAANKRANRAVKSKQKKGTRVTTHGRVPVSSENYKLGQRLESLVGNLERYGLGNPFDKDTIENTDSSMPVNPEELIKDVRKSVTGIYELFSYLALAERMVKNNVLQHSFTHINMDDVAQKLIVMDEVVNRLPAMLHADEEVFHYDILELGTMVADVYEVVYKEIELVEPFALQIEQSLSSSARQLMKEEPAITEADAQLVIRRSIVEELINKFRPKANQEVAE